MATNLPPMIATSPPTSQMVYTHHHLNKYKCPHDASCYQHEQQQSGLSTGTFFFFSFFIIYLCLFHDRLQEQMGTSQMIVYP